VAPYWEFRVPESVEHRDDVLEAFNALLAQAVGDRLRHPSIGIEMSGGLDSTAIAAVAIDQQRSAGGEASLRAYCTTYDPLIADEEGKYSRIAAEWLGVPLRHFNAAGYGLFDYGVGAPPRHPEPAHEVQGGAYRAMSREAARHHRVILTGVDGDAILSESPKPYFRWLARKGSLGRLGMGALSHAIGQRRVLLSRLWQRRGHDALPEGPPYPAWLAPGLASRLGLESRWQRLRNGSGPLPHPIRPYGYSVMRRTILEQSGAFDAYDAGFSGLPVEYRHPLMDLRIVHFCLSLPPWPWCVRKHLLREAMRGRLPAEILARPKSPMAGEPHLPLLQDPRSQWLDQWVASDGLGRYVEREKVPLVFRARDPRAGWTTLRALSLNLWLQQLTPNPKGTHR
jgi:asparagine synthase (glutamine-hydrolysing)